MSCHRALLVADILNEVFSQLSFNSRLREKPESTAELYARRKWYSFLSGCTTVCKTFYDPATRALWRTLPHVIPVLRLLPSFTFVNNAGPWLQNEHETLHASSYWVTSVSYHSEDYCA